MTCFMIRNPLETNCPAIICSLCTGLANACPTKKAKEREMKRILLDLKSVEGLAVQLRVYTDNEREPYQTLAQALGTPRLSMTIVE